MELKRVLGKDNRHAMEQVGKLYGPDALVVSGHKVRDQFELVVAVDIEADAQLINTPDDLLLVDEIGEALNSQPEPKTASFKHVLHDAPEESASLSAQHDALRASEIVALFKDELDVLKREIQETRKASAWHLQVAQPNSLSSWQRGLMEHPMPSRLRTLLVDALAGIEDDDEAEAHLHALLSEGLDQVTETPEDITGVHAFFGPTGSGKTTVVGKLAKMAVEQLGGDHVAIISFNDQKLGAWNQMQLMASQLGVACYRANSGDALQTVLREVADLGCVLIDTSGVELSHQYRTVETFAPEALTHLVVPSEIARATAHRVFEGSMTWDSVNISKLDESTDNWVLLDALSSHDDRRVWLSSGGASLSTPLTTLNTANWVAAVIETIERPVAQSTELENSTIEGRQNSESPSTLEFLTGLRANRSDLALTASK